VRTDKTVVIAYFYAPKRSSCIRVRVSVQKSSCVGRCQLKELTASRLHGCSEENKLCRAVKVFTGRLIHDGTYGPTPGFSSSPVLPPNPTPNSNPEHDHHHQPPPTTTNHHQPPPPPPSTTSSMQKKYDRWRRAPTVSGTLRDEDTPETVKRRCRRSRVFGYDYWILRASKRGKTNVRGLRFSHGKLAFFRGFFFSFHHFNTLGNENSRYRTVITYLLLV